MNTTLSIIALQSCSVPSVTLDTLSVMHYQLTPPKMTRNTLRSLATTIDNFPSPYLYLFGSTTGKRRMSSTDSRGIQEHLGSREENGWMQEHEIKKKIWYSTLSVS